MFANVCLYCLKPMGAEADARLYRTVMKEGLRVQEREMIEVFIRMRKGKTVCICKREAKGCERACQPDVVTRDKFQGWEDTMARNRYGN